MQELHCSSDSQPLTLDFVNVSERAVFELLSDLDTTKACGPDLIPARLLKEGAAEISPSLTKIFNLSLCSGTLPQDWLSAHIVPVHKKNDKSDPSNYRPISLTSIVVKTLERLVHREVVSALESKGLLSGYQYGFRAKRSTVSLLSEAVHDWALALEQRKSVHSLFLDLAKAFDSVPHFHLLLRLDLLGIRGGLLDWFRVFLTCRRQRVLVNGQKSDWIQVRSGVPQGSVLGPLLFILYIDSLHHSVTNSTLKIFADDVTLYRAVSNVSDCQLLQEDLARVYDWTATWQVRLNPAKCEALNLSNKRSPLQFTYTIGSGPILWKSLVRYLGVYINSKLTWSDHCKVTASKASRILNVLRRTMFGCSAHAKDVAYKSIVRPCLEYACVVWNPHSAKDSAVLDAVQNRAARWIVGSHWDPAAFKWTKSSNSCVLKLRWPSLASRRVFLSCLFVFQIFRKQVISGLRKYFVFTSGNTRSHKMSFRTVSSTINSYRYSFVVNSIFLWNNLPLQVISSDSFSTFKKALHKWLFL